MKLTPRLLGLAAGFALTGGMAWADSISPESYEATLNVGESVTINKTVTVDAGVLTTGLVDIFFLADSTGSMGGQINQARTNANTIISGLSGLGDVHFGVGEYRDTGDAFTYRTNTALTGNATAITTGINQWTAGGGGDFPEANLIGLQRVAQETEWRAGSTRVVVMFGDAPGHVGRTDSKPDAFGNFLVSSEANAIAALNAEGITVHIGNTGGTGNSGMNAAAGGAAAGQANRIADATGGSVFALAASGANIADLIKEAVESTFATYNTVALGPVGNMPGVGVEVSAPYVGEFDREETRTFDFTVTFTGLVPGTHDFVINALVNGGTVATERDRITVRGDDVPPIPLPAAGWLLLGGLGALVAVRRRRRA
ncbi:vWA domain-containing protein [Pararhodobacter sp. SW119]|uniref:vWA domain-containing protein n=1 Tax=Pararhodobacter sp. SW119 TaxID=2780075 RepID=UPI001ADF0B6F|nr:vWA domain-containing protein [Pararhodobacter sp. SW119]